MSVKVADRKESDVQFIYNMRMILLELITRYRRMPQKETAGAMISIANTCYYNLTKANATPLATATNKIKDAKFKFIKRERLLEDTLAELMSLQNFIEVTYEKYTIKTRKDKERSIKYLTELIQKEYNLIKAVIKSDYSRYTPI